MKRHLVVGMSLALATAMGNAQAADNSNPVASVNGDVLTTTQFNQALQQRTQGRGGQLPAAQKRQFLKQMVDLQLLAQEAEERDLANKAEVQAQLTNTRRAIVARALIQQISEEGFSDEAVQKVYDEQYGGKEQGKEYKARHILLKDEAKAKALIAKLDDGADFAKLAKDNSTGPTGKKGGELGWFNPAQMVPAFSKAAKALDKGDYTEEPVKTQFGWHVIQLEDVRQAEPPKLEDVRGKITQKLAQQKIQSMVEDLRADASVDYQADWAQPKTSGDSTSGNNGDG